MPLRCRKGRAPSRSRLGRDQGHERKIVAKRLTNVSIVWGPHWDATESLTPMTWWSRTALRTLKPGRWANLLASCWQQTVSARKT